MSIKTKNIIYVLLIFVVFGISYFVSCYSTFYNISFLNYDSTAFYLIGKGIKYGYIPYINLADHKGIYIFFVNFLGALISENQYIGIFIVNFLINCLYVIITYNTILLFSNNKVIGIMSSLTSFVLASSYFFCQGGMKCETMLMPIILYVNFMCLQHLLDNQEKQFGYRKIYVLGIFIGIVLFTKANLCICFLPIIIMCILDILETKKYQLFINYLFIGLIGIIIGILPAIIYGLATNSIKEMLYYTFTVNFQYVNDIYYKYGDLLRAIANIITSFKWVLIFSLLGLFVSRALVRNDKIFLFLTLSFVANIIVSFMSLRPYTYHAYPMLFNILWFIFFIYKIFDIVVDKLYYSLHIKKINILVVFMLMCILILITYMHKFSYNQNITQGYRQYLVNKKLEQYYQKGEKILVIGAAIGAYNYFDVFPTTKYFCIPHTTQKFIEPMYDSLLESIKSGENDWVITSFTPIMNRSKFPREASELLDNTYNYVDDIPLAPATIYKK